MHQPLHFCVSSQIQPECSTGRQPAGLACTMHCRQQWWQTSFYQQNSAVGAGYPTPLPDFCILYILGLMAPFPARMRCRDLPLLNPGWLQLCPHPRSILDQCMSRQEVKGEHIKIHLANTICRAGEKVKARNHCPGRHSGRKLHPMGDKCVDVLSSQQ